MNYGTCLLPLTKETKDLWNDAIVHRIKYPLKNLGDSKQLDEQTYELIASLKTKKKEKKQQSGCVF